MTLHSYLLFVVSSIALALVPGPDMAYLLGRCVAQGRRAGMLAAIGSNAGGYFHLTGAVLGLSAILATSATAFTVVKWVGAAYLIYLGVSALRSRSGALLADGKGGSPRADRTIVWQAFLGDALNPKVAVFFLAFLPQFVSPGVAHPTLQLIGLGVTCNVICLAINLLIAIFSARFTLTLRRNPTFSQWLQRGMGALFVAIGLRLATEKS